MLHIYKLVYTNETDFSQVSHDSLKNNTKATKPYGCWVY